MANLAQRLADTIAPQRRHLSAVPTPTPVPTPPAPPSPEVLKLRDQIAVCEHRLVELEERLGYEQRGSYQHQELASELSATATRRSTLVRRLEDVLAAAEPPTVIQSDRAAKREAFVQREVADRLEVRMEFVRRLEAQGDHQQAKIHRLALLDLRDDVEREYPNKENRR